MTAKLDQLVRETMELTGDGVAPLVMRDDAPVLDDEPGDGFYLVGLIGGKDVGKSALVNALVGQDITPRTSFGPGTEEVIAYAHESQEPALRGLLGREAPGRFRIVTHPFPRLCRQVLLDLPDIDSHWAGHVAIVRRMLRHMLFPVWVQSVEKYADQQPQKLLAQVAQGNDPSNFVFVLNKVDQLADAGPAAACDLRDDFAVRLGRTLSLPRPPHVYLVSAIQPSQYDLPALREAMSQQKTADAVQLSTRLASKQRQRSVLAWLESQHVGSRAARLARLQEEAGELVAQRLGVPLVEKALPRLAGDTAYRLALADAVMGRRVRRWPIVNIVHAVMAPVMALIRANLTPRGASASLPTAEALADGYLNAGGQDVSQSIQSTFALLHQSHPAVSGLYREWKLWEQMPADQSASDLRRGLATTIERQRAALQSTSGSRGGWLWPLRWLLTIGAVFWFPIVQPLLEAFLQLGADPGRFVSGIALLLVRIFGVTFLLKNAGFLLLYFLVLWVVLRWDTQRRVSRRMTRWQAADMTEPSLSLPAQAIEWIDGLIQPIRDARERADALDQRIAALRSSLREDAAA